MSPAYFNDISVYFHMRNHFKMLKNVKSVVDTAPPEGYLRSGMYNFEKRVKGTTNEHLRRIYNTNRQGPSNKRRGGVVKKHSCINLEVKSEGFLIKDRNKGEQAQIVDEPQSDVIKFRRPSVLTPRSTVSEPQHLLAEEISNHNQNETPSSSARSVKSQSGDILNLPLDENLEDQEYLLFLLRITEDIISNDFYSNSDIRKIFESHMQLNRNRLNTDKMHQHIMKLCKELNIDFNDYDIDKEIPNNSDVSSDDHKLNSSAFRECEDCSTIRASSLHRSSLEDEQINSSDKLNGNSFNPSLLLTKNRTEVSSTIEVSSTENQIDLVQPKEPKDFDTFIKELNEIVPPDNEKIQMDSNIETHLDESIDENLCNVEESENYQEILLENNYQTEDNIDSFRAENVKSDSKIQFPETVENVPPVLNVSMVPSAVESHQMEEPSKISLEPTSFIWIPLEDNNKTVTNNETKLILPSTINEEDYVMIKGPVYVYKPLLDFQPKLLIVSDSAPEIARAESPISHHTFTVEKPNPDLAELHSVPDSTSIENLLEVNRYLQSMDMKLLNSDYDLTPEKDDSGKKYHTDTTTNISRLNITENLLLNDDYIVHNQTEDKSIKLVENFDNYARMDAKLLETNDYVLHRKLESSASLSKLKLFNCKQGDKIRLEKTRSFCHDLINIDFPSQDSSLRSEGETLFHHDNATNWKLIS